ncbi:MAG: cytochrome C [Aquificae bacterium]|nr:cytochrome C [Aquificota bacterium]
MIIKKILPVILGFSFFAQAGIELTKHNLSVSGPGTIKATSETEICVFCHIPHHEREGTPLWNRKMPVTTYTLYDSEFIRRINYPEPLQPSTTEGQPGIVSRQCLSCHDGTVAIGAVYIVRGTELGDTMIIDVQNVASGGTLPTTLRTYVGTNLSIHHPVAIEYNPNISKTFGDGSVKTVELKNPPSQPIKLYDYGGTQYVECTSCHDPHKQNKQFLRVDVGNLAQDFNQTCISCHEKTGWDTSIHATSTDVYNDSGITTHYGEGTPVSVADLGCGNCHVAHNSPPYPPSGKPLLRSPEEQTCFSGASGNRSLAPCHSTGGTKNIEAVLPPNKVYGHPVMTISNIHTILDVLYGFGSTETDPAGAKTVKFTDSKHAECVDCHNPHAAQQGTHADIADATGWYPQNPTNNVSGAILGVYGVEPVWAGLWTQPTQFTTMVSANKEYQICLKCHSYWGLGQSPTLDCRTNITSDQQNITKLTDQACEFSPDNRSAHPVIMPLSSMPGRYAGNPIALKPPWNLNIGNKTMYCSDCHGADNEIGGDPRGPHGSNHMYVLKGPSTNWPEKAAGQPIRLSDIGTVGIFCENCHDLNAVRAHTIPPHVTGSNAACVDCHIVIPHGSPVSKLLGYDTFPAPYNYGGNSLKIRKYKWNSGFNKTGVYSTFSPCNSFRCHGNDLTDYDTTPYGP